MKFKLKCKNFILSSLSSNLSLRSFQLDKLESLKKFNLNQLKQYHFDQYILKIILF